MNSYNITPASMRDTSVDEVTGWLDPGKHWDRDPKFLRGLNGLGAAKQVGREYISEALADPATRETAKSLLAEGPDALARQAQKDAEEFAFPSGKQIVFKRFARDMGQRLQAASDALMQALPNKTTESGTDAFEILQYVDDKEKALELFYTELALEAFDPGFDAEAVVGIDGYDDEDEAMGVLGHLGMSKKGKRWAKYGAIAVGTVAVVAGAVVAGPAIIGALGAVTSTVGTVAKGVFGGGGGAPPSGGEVPFVDTTPQPGQPGYDPLATTTPTWEQERQASPSLIERLLPTIANVGLSIWALKRQGRAAEAETREAEAVSQLQAQGMSREQAVQYVQQAQYEASQQAPEPQPDFETPEPGGVSPVKAGFEGAIPLLMVGAVALIAMGSKKGGGGGGRTRVRSSRRRR